MFTGIIETLGEVTALEKEEGNVHLSIKSSLTPELKIDQSVAHNGVCLTVVKIESDVYTVTAVQETLNRSNLGHLQVGDAVNIERCMQLGARLDGHMVQGHVDTTGVVTNIQDEAGSTKFFFEYPEDVDQITVEKGSITVNGVSLTVIDSTSNGFSVIIIPYTIEHTNFHIFKKGTPVNLEFDIIGKYIQKYQARINS